MANEAKLKEAISLVRQATAVLQECIEEYGGEIESSESTMTDSDSDDYSPPGKSANRMGAMLAVMGKKGNASR